MLTGSTVNIFGVKYIIKEKPIIVTADGTVNALIDFEAATIYLTKGQDEEDRIQSFLHECFHGCLERLSISQTLERKQEEIIVDSLANFVAETFKVSLRKGS